MDEYQMEVADALSRAEIETGIDKARVQKPKPVGFDGHCGCGNEVPEGRIKLGFYNCVHCQQTLEGRRKFFAR